MTARTSTNFWLDVISLAVMIGLVFTGGLIHFVLPAGSGHFYVLFGWNRHDIGQLHFYLAVVALLLLVLHLLLHWDWVCCVIAKMVQKNNPSRRSRTTWGLSSLLVFVMLLGGGLFWASSLVQRTIPEGAGRGRRAQGSEVTANQVMTGTGHAVGKGVPEEGGSLPVMPLGTQPSSQPAQAREQHVEECPAGASINGRTSLMEAARTCGMGVAQLTKQLGLPSSTDPGERLGRLKRAHGLDLHAVRKMACR